MDRDWESNVLGYMVIFMFLMIVVGLPLLTIIKRKTEVAVFNKAHNTKYTLQEWLFAESTIKDYINDGKHQTIKLKGE